MEVELFWALPGLRSASMQNRDLGRLEVVDCCDTRIGDEDLLLSNPMLEETDPGELGDDNPGRVGWPPKGEVLRGGVQGGEVEFGRIFPSERSTMD